MPQQVGLQVNNPTGAVSNSTGVDQSIMADIVRLYALDPHANESLTKQNAGYSDQTTLMSQSKDGQNRDLGGPESFLTEPTRPDVTDSASARNEQSNVTSGKPELRLVPIKSSQGTRKVISPDSSKLQIQPPKFDGPSPTPLLPLSALIAERKNQLIAKQTPLSQHTTTLNMDEVRKGSPVPQSALDQRSTPAEVLGSASRMNSDINKAVSQLDYIRSIEPKYQENPMKPKIETTRANKNFKLKQLEQPSMQLALDSSLSANLIKHSPRTVKAQSNFRRSTNRGSNGSGKLNASMQRSIQLKEADEAAGFRQVNFPTQTRPIIERSGQIIFKKESSYHATLESLTADLAKDPKKCHLSHRDAIKMFKAEQEKKKAFDAQHQWKLQRGTGQLKQGLKAQLRQERQILLKSFLSENEAKRKQRTLSQFGDGKGPKKAQPNFAIGPNYHSGRGSVHEPRQRGPDGHVAGSTLTGSINLAELNKNHLFRKSGGSQGFDRNLNYGANDLKMRLRQGIAQANERYPQFSTLQATQQGVIDETVPRGSSISFGGGASDGPLGVQTQYQNPYLLLPQQLVSMNVPSIYYNQQLSRGFGPTANHQRYFVAQLNVPAANYRTKNQQSPRLTMSPADDVSNIRVELDIDMADQSFSPKVHRLASRGAGPAHDLPSSSGRTTQKEPHSRRVSQDVRSYLSCPGRSEKVSTRLEKQSQSPVPQPTVKDGRPVISDRIRMNKSTPGNMHSDDVIQKVPLSQKVDE